MRVYIAGPMSNLPLYNFPAFDGVAHAWREQGHYVSSPADITRALWWERYGRQYDPATDCAEWGDPVTSELFRRDLAAVWDADVIVLLPGWPDSRGAKMEIAVACALGKRFICAATLREMDIEATAVVHRSLALEGTSRVA